MSRVKKVRQVINMYQEIPRKKTILSLSRAGVGRVNLTTIDKTRNTFEFIKKLKRTHGSKHRKFYFLQFEQILVAMRSGARDEWCS